MKKNYLNLGMYIGLNPISQALLITMLGLLLIGGLELFHGNILGLILLLIGAWICTGFDYPDPSPKKVWLITVFGQKTTVKSYGLTLLWPPFVRRVEFKLQKIDHDFPIRKPILCTVRGKTSSDAGVEIEGYLTGLVSTSMIPDDEDDPETIPASERKTGGEKLRDFDDAGGMEEVKKQLDDVFTAWIQNIADNKGVDMVWMETNGLKIAEILLPCIVGKTPGIDLKKITPSIGDDLDTNQIENSHLDDARGLGVRFTKFQVLLEPKDPKVVDARNRLAQEKAQRLAQLQNTATMNEKIAMRASLYRNGVKNPDGTIAVPPDSNPASMRDARAELIQEDLVDDGKATLVMNKDGVTIVDGR
jgi:hypothetical protein